MIHLRVLSFFFIFLRGGARRSIRIDHAHYDAQQQNNTLANGLEVTAAARETLIPASFQTGGFRRAALQAGTLREGSKQDGPRAGHLQPHRAAPWFLFGPRRAKVALQEAVEEGSQEAAELRSKRPSGTAKWRPDGRLPVSAQTVIKAHGERVLDNAMVHIQALLDNPKVLLGFVLTMSMLAAKPVAATDGTGSSVFDTVPGGLAGALLIPVGVFLLVTLLAGRGSLEAGAALMVVFFGGDPDERVASGANDNEVLRRLALAVTPSAWKKAYGGEGVRPGEVRELLDLPAWQGDEARELEEPEAVANVKSMQLAPIDVEGVAEPVDTCFVSLQPDTPANAPPVVLIHGFDSSILEFRYIIPSLLEAGLRVEAMEWWTGGFTARRPFIEALEANTSNTPWDLIRKHQHAFIKSQLGDTKCILLGASLGGAVAIDFAVSHPESVEKLILMDAGGESYAQPEPRLTALAADPVVNLFQWRADNGLLPYPHVWSKEDGWRQALRAYLKSGGYQNRVNSELIKTVPVPTLVLWGEEDDVLSPQDVFKYKADLPRCDGVLMIPNAQHAPALENPTFVREAIIAYAKDAQLPPSAPMPARA